MMGIINLIQKRPSDKSIRIGRVGFGLIYLLVMFYNLIYLGKDIDSSYLFGYVTINDLTKMYLKYFISSIGIIPVIMGAFDVCLFKKKYAKIVHIVFGIIMFYISGMLIPNPKAVLDYDFLIGFMGIVPLLGGATGKIITIKCSKYKEKITKIRV